MALTDLQQARMDRMLTVATQRAATGGFDDVQMRIVADDADVALGTLYRYFPSKEYLLVAAMQQQISNMSERLVANPALGSRPSERVLAVLERANKALFQQEKFTRAVIRALVSGDERVAPVVTEVRDQMTSIIALAISSSEPVADSVVAIDDDTEMQAMLIQEVWLAALVTWISGVAPSDSVMEKLRAATLYILEASQ